VCGEIHGLSEDDLTYAMITELLNFENGDIVTDRSSELPREKNHNQTLNSRKLRDLKTIQRKSTTKKK
jgi:hypothetical protein